MKIKRISLLICLSLSLLSRTYAAEDISLIESFEASTTGSITPGNSFTGDIGTNEWDTSTDGDGTLQYEIQTSTVKAGAKAIRVSADYGTGDTTAIVSHDIATVDQIPVAKGQYFVGFCQPPTSVSISAATHYKLNDDAASTTIVDSSPNANNGTLNTNTENRNATGKINGGIQFTTTGDNINANSISALDDMWAGAGTFAAWLYITESGGIGIENNGSRIFDKGSSLLICQSSGTIRFQATFSTQAGRWEFSHPVGEWFHLVIIYSSNSDTFNPNVYINNESVTVSEVLAPSGTYVSDAASTMYIGNRPAADRTFEGTMDDVRFYSSQITSSDRDVIYNSGTGTEIGSTSGNIEARLHYDDDGTTREIRYVIARGTSIPSETGTVKYFDLRSTFTAGSWGSFQRNVFIDFQNKYDTSSFTRRFDVYNIRVEKIEFVVEDFGGNGAVEAYFDYMVEKGDFRMISPEIVPWNIIDTGINDTIIEEFDADTNNSYTYEENPAGQMHLDAQYSSGGSHSKVQFTTTKGISSGNSTTHLIKFKVNDLGTSSDGDTTGIRFVLVNSSPTSEYFSIIIHNDQMKDTGGGSNTQSISISNGNTYYIRIVMNHGSSGSGTGSVYFNGSGTPLSISAASGGASTIANFGSQANSSGSNTDIILLSWKAGTGAITSEATDTVSNFPWIYQTAIALNSSDFSPYKISGTTWVGYYAASRWPTGTSTVPNQNTARFFRVTSTDGKTWGTPSLTFWPSIDGSGEDEKSIFTPCVIHDGTDYWMYYSGTPLDNMNDRVLYLAKSSDGISWTRQNGGNEIVPLGSTGAWDDIATYAPSVIRIASNDWVMYYAAASSAHPRSFLRATSTDGISWTKDTTNVPILQPTAATFDKDGILYPQVIRNASDDWEMYYTGIDATDPSIWRLKAGKATSTNGTSFTKSTNNPVFSTSDKGEHVWNSLYISTGTVAKISASERWMYYFGRILDYAGGTAYDTNYHGGGLGISLDKGESFNDDVGLSIVNQDPPADGTGTPSQDIYFEENDNTFIIDPDLVDVQIDINSGGFNDAVINGVFQSGWNGTNSAIVSDGGTGVNVTIDRTTDFTVDDVITVKATAENINNESLIIEWKYTVVAGAKGGFYYIMRQQNQ